MGQRHPLLIEWAELGDELAFAFPRPEILQRLMQTLRALAKTETGNALEAIWAMAEVASGGRCDLEQDELLLLVEERIREARRQVESLMGLSETLHTSS